MPLRDHFRPPVDDSHSWDELHGMWPAAIVQHIQSRLPPGYVAAPQVHLGGEVEIDVAAFEQNAATGFDTTSGDGGTATATWTETLPIVTVETALTDDDEYEVRVFDTRRGRRLVAAVEIVSPANKDRPQKRAAFVGKCTGLLRKGVAVSVVDLVTVRQVNLFAELVALVGHPELMPGDPPAIYAAACRLVSRGKKTMLDAVSLPLAVGQPLPTVPLWLAPNVAFPLDLETSYEAACRDLRIP